MTAHGDRDVLPQVQGALQAETPGMEEGMSPRFGIRATKVGNKVLAMAMAMFQGLANGGPCSQVVNHLGRLQRNTTAMYHVRKRERWKSSLSSVQLSSAQLGPAQPSQERKSRRDSTSRQGGETVSTALSLSQRLSPRN